MLVEEIIRKIRALPVRLRFHLLFAVFVKPETASDVVSLLDVHGDMLSEIAREISSLPVQVRLPIIASELKESLVR